jgi:hypothetical protein
MKSFKKYISEAPFFDATTDFGIHAKRVHLMDPNMPFNHAKDVRDAVKAPTADYPAAPNKGLHVKIGELGPYKVYHSPEQDKHSFIVKHEQEPIGHVDFIELPKPKKLPGASKTVLYPHASPTFAREHTGKRAKVPNLAANVYMMAAKHLKKSIMSGDAHTHGSHSMWKDITHLGGSAAFNEDTDEHIPVYKPEEHESKVYGIDYREHGSWKLIHHPEK